MRSIASALSLDAAASAGEVAGALSRLVELEREVLRLSGQRTVPEALRTLRDAAERAAQVDGLCDSLCALHARAREAEVAALIDRAATPDAQGRVRLPPAQRRWAEAYGRRDPDGLKEYLAVAPLLRRGAGGGASGTDLRGGLRWETTPFLELARLKSSNPAQYEALRRDFEDRRRNRRSVFAERLPSIGRGPEVWMFDGGMLDGKRKIDCPTGNGLMEGVVTPGKCGMAMADQRGIVMPAGRRLVMVETRGMVARQGLSPARVGRQAQSRAGRGPGPLQTRLASL